jgi:hypothetical protein
MILLLEFLPFTLVYYLGHAPFSHGSESVLASLTAYRDGKDIFLAIEKGGIRAYEEFVLRNIYP